MSRVLSQREQDTIRRIEEREKLANVRARHKPAAPAAPAPRSIPKKPSYYLEQAKKLQATDPHHADIYRKAAKLSAQKKHVEVTNLLRQANQALERNRVPVAPPRQSALMQRLRDIARAPGPPPARPRGARVTRSSQARRLEEEYSPETLDDYVVDYAQKVKKRKELLYEFLKRHFEHNEKYSARAQRFVTIRSDRGRRRA